MSIPGKVLIALLCALAAAAAFTYLNPDLPLLALFPPAALAALSAVILSHRALPMPGAIAPRPAVDQPTSGSPAKRSDRASTKPRDRKHRGRESGESGKRGSNEEREEKAGNKRSASPKNGKKRERGAESQKRGPAASPAAEAPPAAALEEGTVKWFNVTKGYGFIIRGNGEEIFVHHRSVQGEGRGRLDDGTAVRFRVADTDKGPQAEDVQAL